MQYPDLDQLMIDRIHRLKDVESTILNPETSEKILDEALREQQQIKVEIDELITIHIRSDN